MADDPTPRPDLKGVLDLSTGPGAPPPPAPVLPKRPVTPDPEVRVGRALDLSKRPPATDRRPPVSATLGDGPVIRETIDLSTATPPAPEPTPAPTAERRDDRGRGRRDDGRGGSGGRTRDRDRGKAPASAGESLADLLSPEMLAKLRGG